MYRLTLPPVMGVSKKRAGLGHAFDRLHELGHDFRPLGIAEVEIVGGGDGQRTDSGEIAAALGDHELGAFARIEGAVAAVAVQGHGDGGAGLLDADDGGVATGSDGGVGADHVVVLLPDPALVADVGAGEDGGQG